MSEESTPVTEKHFRYLAERTRGEDAFLRDLRQASAAAGIPQIAISPEQASFLQILVKLGRVRELIEVGTLAGYSAIALARALPQDGRVRTIELDPDRAEFAREWVARSDVAGRVEVFCGDGAEVLRTFERDSADACFLDADKAGYGGYLAECLRIVRRGGLFLVDNAFAFGQLFESAPTDPEAPAVQKFNELMPTVGQLHSIIVPIGDGCWVGVKE